MPSFFLAVSLMLAFNIPNTCLYLNRPTMWAVDHRYKCAGCILPLCVCGGNLEMRRRCANIFGLNIQVWKRTELTSQCTCWMNDAAYFWVLCSQQYHIFKVGVKVFLILTEIANTDSTRTKCGAEICCCYNNAFHSISKALILLLKRAYVAQ